jgi:tetratricopeptide (TPR) repeat protein
VNLADLLRRGFDHHRAGQFASARACYERAVAARPDNPDALHLLAAVLLETGEPRAALPHAQRAVLVSPRRSDCLTILAHTHFALEQYADAKEAFERAAALERDNPALEMGVANCLALLGEHAQAEARLRRLVERRPAFADAWFNLANCVRDQNRALEAVALYRKVLELRPDFVEACHSLGHLLALQGENADAERLYRRCIELRPGYFPVYANLSRLLLDERRLDELEAFSVTRQGAHRARTPRRGPPAESAGRRAGTAGAAGLELSGGDAQGTRA